MSAQGEYWEDAVSDAFEQAGIFKVWRDVPAEQRATIGRALESASECMSMAFPAPPSPYPDEIANLKADLRRERSKIGCRPCGGTGRLIYNAGPWGVNAHCDACHGEGKVLP